MRDTRQQRVDVAVVVVRRHRDARRAVEVEPVHQRLRAMMAGAHRDPERIERLRHVVGMHAVQHEGHDRIAVLQARRAEDLRTVDLLQPVHEPLHQRHLVVVRARPVERLHPGAGRTQTDGRADRRSPCLEAARRRRPCRLGQGHAADHRAAAHEGRHRVEKLRPAPQHADPVRPIGLVPSEGVEIDAQRRKVDGPVRRALRTVEHHLGAGRLGRLHHGTHVEQGAGDI